MTDETLPAPANVIRRVSTAICIIGVAGSGKTSLLATFADYLWDTYQRILLLYSWDGGAIPTDVQVRIKQGLIRFWRVRTRSAEGLGLDSLYKATKGCWPRRINAITGETAPAVEMVPPVTANYELYCDEGHLLLIVQSANLISPMFCPTCKNMKALTQIRVRETITRTKGFEAVGGVAFDGLTSMTNVVMDHMDHQRGAGQIGGEKPAFGGVVTSGDTKLGGNNRADVGFGQSRGRQFVDNTLSIPYLVEGPVFTALTNETTDEGGLPIVGIKLPGQAATDEASAWFGNVFEMGKSKDDGGKDHFTLYLRPFTDAQNRRHLLKTSSSPDGTPSSLPDKLVDPAKGQGEPFSQANLGYVFRTLDEDLRRALLKERPGAPGIPTEFMEYGESLVLMPTPPLPGAESTPAVAPAPRLTAPPVIALSVAAGSGAAPGPPPSAAPPVVMGRARKRGVLAAPAPTPAPATPAPSTPAAVVAPGASVAPPLATVPTMSGAPTAAMGPASGTAPPPPPGAKPPARAPGA